MTLGIGIMDRLTNEEIACFLRQLFWDLYGTLYTKQIKVRRLEPIGYEVKIPLSNDERPLVLAIEAEGDKYLKLLKTAIQESNLGKAKFFVVNITYDNGN